MSLNSRNASSTFREGLRPYHQKKPKRLPSKKAISKASNWKSVLKDVVDATKFVVGMINTQNKICDTTLSAQAVTNTGFVQPITLMGQGTDIVNRLGEEIHPKEIDVRLVASIGSSTVPVTMRVVIFRDRNCNGGIPNVTDVLSVVTPAPVSHYNYFNFQGDDMPRFDILMDETFALAPASDQNQVLLEQIKLKEDDHIHYLGTANAYASLGKGNIFLLAISSVATSVPLLDFNSRLNYLSF